MRLWITVQTGKKKSEVISSPGLDELLVRVKELPREGRANNAVRIALAEHFGAAPSDVRIIKGLRSRRKLAEVTLCTVSSGPGTK
jgi:uncharacterized protein YggU (UPF0235/DUF167 family)